MEALGVFGVVVAVIVFVWVILGLLIPFMVWSIMESNKQVLNEIKQLNYALRRNEK